MERPGYPDHFQLYFAAARGLVHWFKAGTAGKLTRKVLLYQRRIIGIAYAAARFENLVGPGNVRCKAN
jgi:hypothetical protein